MAFKMLASEDDLITTEKIQECFSAQMDRDQNETGQVDPILEEIRTIFDKDGDEKISWEEFYDGMRLINNQ